MNRVATVDERSAVAAGTRSSAVDKTPAERLSEHIQRIVDSAPPLTTEQRCRLTALLRNGPRSQ